MIDHLDGADAEVGIQLEAAPGAEFRYWDMPLRRMTAEELAATVDPGRVHDYDLLGTEE